MDRFPRMLTRTATAMAVLSLCGCAIFSETYGIQEVDNWVRSNEPHAESGKMKWSDFYAQYLEKVSAAPVISQGPAVERLGIMITASLFYERGRLDKAGFDSVQRIVRTYQTIDDAAANTLARDALVRALEQKAAGAQPGTSFR
jgi:predicted transcriptional regulator